MSTIFISHSSHDNRKSDEIMTWLDREGHGSAFLDFDPEDGIPAGRNWERELYQQLRSCRAVIVLCSTSSMASRWCFAEITQARALGKVLLPVKIDNCTIDGILDDHQVVDLTSDPNEGYERLRRGLLAAGLDPTDAFDWDSSRVPYPGLLSFQESDAAVFFGRDEEIGAGLDLMNQIHRLGTAGVALVVGASGSGKSSLVRAGLVPRLRRDRERWLVVDPFRPRDDPVAELAAVLHAAFHDAGEARDRAEIRTRLVEAARDAATPNPLVAMAGDLRRVAERSDAKMLLVVDQLEELLGPTPNDDGAGIVRLLRTACEAPGCPVVMIGTIRADFLGVFQKHPALLRLRCEFLQVGPMSREDVTKVIEEPANVAGVELESGLADVMLDDSNTEDALPLLAFTLRELWDRFGEDRCLEIDEYRSLGGPDGALARAADEVFDSQLMTSEQQEWFRDAVLAMVRLTEDNRWVRRVARWDEIDPRIHEVLQRFVAARLLVAGGDADHPTVEVAHEALFRSWRRLASWLEYGAEAMRVRRDLERASVGWDTSHRDPSDLWRGTRLARAVELTRDIPVPLGVVDAEFVEASVRAERAQAARDEQRRRRRLQTAIGVAVTMTLLALIAGVFYVQARSASDEAKRNARESGALTLAAESRSLTDVNPALSLVLAAEAARTTPELPQAVTALFGARRAFAERSGQQVGEPLTGHRRAVYGVAFSPDGRLLASAGGDNEVRLWDSRDGSPVVEPLDDHEAEVLSVAFSPDGQLLASASNDGTVRLWDTRDGSAVGEPLDDHEAAVLSVAFSPDGRMLASAGADGTVRLWDTRDGSPIGSPIPGDARWVEEVAFSPDGRMLASAGADGTVRLWDPTNQRPVGEPLPGHGVAVGGLAFSRDGRLLVAHDDGVLQLWNPTDGSQMGEPILGHRGPVEGVAFSPDGLRFASAGSDGTVRLWNAASQTSDVEEVVPPLTGHAGGVTSVAFSQQGLLASAGSDQTVRLWDPRPGSPVGEPLGRRHDAVRAVAFSPDGRVLASAGDDWTIRLWDPRDGQPVGALTGSDGAIAAIAFSPDGRLLASGDDDWMVRLWDPGAGSEVDALAGHRGAVEAVAFSPDGRVLASAGDDGTIRLWDPSTREPVGEPMVHSVDHDVRAVEAVAFSPDGRLLASAGTDGVVRLWDLRDGSPVGEPLRHSENGTVFAVAFSPDGELLVTAGTDQDVRLWDLSEGTQILGPLQGHSGWVIDVAFRSDGRLLASAGQDGTIRLWDPSTGSPIGEPLGDHTGWVTAVAFSPDGQLLASAGDDETVRLWNPWSADAACTLAAPYVTRAQVEDYLPPDWTPTVCVLDTADYDVVNAG